MSSYREEIEAIKQTIELIPQGRYYLVDCSDEIEEFMKVPDEVRMHAVAEGEELTPYDMVDVELSTLVPVLCEKNFHDDLQTHVQEILDDGVDILREEMTSRGIDVEERIIPNTAQQLAHSEAVFEFAHSMAQRFREMGLYSESGELLAEYHTLLPDGLVVMRSAFD